MNRRSKGDTEVIKALSRRERSLLMKHILDITALVIDDETMARELIRLMLASAGMTVVEANHGAKALDLLRSGAIRPDVILVDIMMPNQSGYDVCRAIRQLPLSAETPIIMLSGKATSHSESLAREAGADQLIVKPVEHPALVQQIHDLIFRAA